MTEEFESGTATLKEPSTRALAFARRALLEAGDPAASALVAPPQRRPRLKDGQAHHDHQHFDHYDHHDHHHDHH